MSDPNADFQLPPPPTPEAEPISTKQRPKNVRVAGIVFFGLGLIIVVAGIANFLPGGIGTGAAVCFLGVLLVGLSFIPLPDAGPNDPEPVGTLERLLGIFYEPTRVFRNLRAHPRWVAGFLVVAILSAAYVAAFTQRLTAERIINYTVDKMAEAPFIPPAAVEQAREQGLQEAKSTVQSVNKAIKSTVGLLVLFVFVAALYLLLILAFGGRINFWQALAVTIFAALPPAVINKVVSFLLLYLKSTDDIHPLMGQETLVQDNLGILFTPAERPVLFVIAASIGVLSFYKLWLTAKGLKEGGQRVSSSAAWSVAITLWVVGLLFIVGITSLFPSFIS